MRRIDIADPGVVQAVQEALQHGVVAIPTDTVYGLAALPRFADRLGAIKGRPEGMPVALLGLAEQVTNPTLAGWPSAAVQVAQACWPGPLTLVLPAAAGVGELLAPAGRVGLRAPDLTALEPLFTATNVLAVTSANLHGRPPATTADGVAEAMGEAADEVALVVDGGTCDGVVSTVLAVDGAGYELIREGAISAARVAELLA